MSALDSGEESGVGEGPGEGLTSVLARAPVPELAKGRVPG